MEKYILVDVTNLDPESLILAERSLKGQFGSDFVTIIDSLPVKETVVEVIPEYLQPVVKVLESYKTPDKSAKKLEQIKEIIESED